MKRRELDAHLALFHLSWPVVWESVQAAHREQVSLWHPDRFSEQRQKAHATEHVKRLNVARDALRAALQAGLRVCVRCGEALLRSDACTDCAERERDLSERKRLEEENRKLRERERKHKERPPATPPSAASSAPPPAPALDVSGRWISADGVERWLFEGRDPHYTFQIFPAVVLPFIPVMALGSGQAVRNGSTLTVRGQIMRIPFFPEQLQLDLICTAATLSGTVRDGLLVRGVLLVRAP